MLLSGRKIITDELVKKEDDMMKAAVAICSANIIFFLANNIILSAVSENAELREGLTFLFLQIFVVVAVWFLSVLSVTDEDRIYLSGIDFLLRQHFGIRSAMIDGSPFVNHSHFQ